MAAAPTLLKVAQTAASYYGAPAENDWSGLRDDDSIELTIRVRVGDIKDARRAIAKDLGEGQ
jgi:hypothetical protein